MYETGQRRVLPDQSLGSGYTLGTSRYPYITDPVPAKRVCFYKSGDPQFSGLRMVISNRTFKTFDALLDSLSKKVPLPFGVRNITTPRGVHAVHTLEELEDGKSYICSDRRKVKPINLALARKKLPPWYHVRPVSARHHTPKRLMVFRNGNPSVRHILMLQKRTTPTFESLLDHISELMRFHVVKLHTLDGRRVDGLPALILCSGVVVAAGREPFRSGNYNAQKSPGPIRLPTNPTGPRRLKLVNHGRKQSKSTISKSRNFSRSSERYILHQIQNSITENVCDLPSNRGYSVELERGHMLESVAESEGDTCHGNGTEGQSDCLPIEDNIEKSFQVNEDGSMTVEMKVRLTVKEEETIHWTTTLARSSVANQLNVTCLPEPEPQLQQENSSLESNPLQSQNPTASIDTTRKSKFKDDDDNDPPSPSLDNRIDSDNGDEEDHVKVHTNAASLWRAPTPGPKHIRKKQISVESIKSVTAEDVQEGMVGSYSYREQTENGAVTEQYRMVKQSSTRPVPKPRRHRSVEVSSRNNRNISTFKSVGMTEILQIENREEEVTETAFHLHEEQTCQDNFAANSHFSAQSVSMSGILYGRPGTSDTAHFSSSYEFETELERPCTASDYMSPPVINVQIKRSPKPTKGRDALQSSKENPQQRVVSKAKRISSKPKVVKKRVRRIRSAGKRQKDTNADAPHHSKKGKTFTSAEFLKRIYGFKPKSSTVKVKKKHTHNGEGVRVKKRTPDLSDDTMKQDPNISSPAEENNSEAISSEMNMLDVPPTEVSQPRGILTRQKSLHRKKKNKSTSPPALNSSSTLMNEYVEDWLEKVQKVEVITQVGAESEESEINPTCPSIPLPDSLLEPKAKQRIQCPNKSLSSNPSLEKAATTQQIVHTDTTMTITANCDSLGQKNAEEITPSNISSETNPPLTKTSTEMSSDNKSTLVKISVQKVTPSISGTEKASAETSEEKTEPSATEHCVMDASSVVSSPLYRLSSLSSLSSEDQPLSITSTSEKAPSSTDHTLPQTASVPSTQREAALPRNPSVKRTRLVSNHSFERKMSLKKASLDNAATDEVQTNAGSPWRAPTPGHPTPKKQASVESIKSGIAEDVQEGMVGSYSYREETENGVVTEQYPMVKQSSTRPVPKPRRHRSVDVNSRNNRNISTLKSVGMTEILQAGRPFTASESISIWRAENMSLASDLTMSSLKMGADYMSPPAINVQKQRSPKPTKGKDSFQSSKENPQQRVVSKAKKISSKTKVVKKRVRRIMSAGKRQKDTVAVAPHNSKKGKTFTSAEFLKRIYGFKPKSSMVKVKKKHTHNGEGVRVKKKMPELSDGTIKQDPNTSSPAGENKGDAISFEMNKLDVPSTEVNQPRGILTRQKSLHQENKNEKEFYDVNKSMSLPVLNTSSSVINEYVEDWLEKAQKVEAVNQVGAESEESEINPTCPSSKSIPLPDSLLEPKVKQRIQSPNKSLSSSPSLEKTTTTEQSVHTDTAMTNTANCNSLAQKNAEEITPPSGKIASETNPPSSKTSTEMSSDSEVENKSAPSVQKVTPPNSRTGKASPPAESSEEKTELPGTERCVTAASSEESRTLHRLSSLSSQASDDQPVSISPTSDKAPSSKASLPRNASVKRARLVSNHSFERKMSLKKASLDKSALTSDASVEITPSSTPINTSMGTQQPSEALPENTSLSNSISDLASLTSSSSCSISASLASLTSEDRASPASRSSNEAPTPTNLPLKEPEVIQTPSQLSTQKQASTPKPLVKKAKLISSPSPEKKLSTRKSSSEKSELLNDPNAEKTHVTTSPYLSRTPLPRSHSLKSASSHDSLDQTASPNLRKLSAPSPSTERQPLPRKAQQQKRLSPYSQSLEVVSPPIRPKSKTKLISRTISSENESEPTNQTNQTLKRTPSQSCSDEEGQNNPSANKYVEQKGSWEKNVANPGVEQQSPSQEEQPEVEWKELTVITEEGLFDPGEEEEQGDHIDDEEQIKQRKELLRSPRNLIEDQDSYIIKDNSSLIIQPSNLEKHYSFDVDEDSGNDHNSCEEHEVDKPKAKDEQCCTIEDELSYEEKESTTEEEHVYTDRDIKTYAEHQERHAKGKPSKECEKAVEELKHQSEEIISQSVAERVSLLEKQVADAQWRKNMLESTTIRKDFASDSPSDLCTRSAPLSSLSFSYDSGGVITKEPEGNRVRYIKEMFLAKSAADIQHGQRGFPSSNTSETLDGRPETSNSGGYQSQTSSELSSGEDDSTRKGISKGFVRRTIERLYGKKDATAAEAASQRPTSAPKPEKKESSSIFSPFHQAQSKLMSDLSYFSSTNTLDTLSEATRCLAFNAQVVPRDTVPIDKGRWLLRDDPQITKSVSDPVGINKTSENSQQDEDENTKEDVPYSLFSTKSDSEDKGKLVSTKCTYFSLPHASESDFSQDDQSTVRKGSVNGDSAVEMKDLAENKKRPEKNSMRPAVIATDFKMPDNKIHPLVPAGEAVVVQPKKGHGVVHRRPQEPDVLDVMYTFCGQHCPIL